MQAGSTKMSRERRDALSAPYHVRVRETTRVSDADRRGPHRDMKKKSIMDDLTVSIPRPAKPTPSPIFLRRDNPTEGVPPPYCI